MAAEDAVRFVNPPAAPPARGYSQAAVAPAGRLAFISGQVGVDLDWRLAEGFDAQADLAFSNLTAAARTCGADLGRIVKLTVFVRRAEDLAAYCAVRDRHFAGRDAMPASSFIVVAGLYDERALIEIEAVIAVPHPPGGGA